MTTVAIDTLAAMRKLEKAGFKTEQAEAVAEVMANQSSELATKADIAGVRGEIAGIRREVAGLRWMFGIQFALTLLILARVFDVIGAGAGG